MNYQQTSGSSFRVKDLAYMGIAAALISVCAWISIPTVVPFTLQTFGVFLVLSLLGWRRGTLAVLVYILLGAIGIPVFSGFSGGPGILLGNTGGYIVGFLAMGGVYGLTLRLLGKSLRSEILGLVLGLLVCYALGTVWFMVVYARSKGAVEVGTVLSWCVIPFIIPDLIKLSLALLLSRRIGPSLKL